ncbi:hypothetical protein ACSQ67_003303 [Phaseolus vulgaris]
MQMNLFTIYGEDILSGGGDSIAVLRGSGGGCSDNGAKISKEREWKSERVSRQRQWRSRVTAGVGTSPTSSRESRRQRLCRHNKTVRNRLVLQNISTYYSTNKVGHSKKRAYLAVLKAFMYERKDELSWGALVVDEVPVPPRLVP